MGLFGDLDIESAADDPFAVPDNTYYCYVTDMVAKAAQSGKNGLNIEYTVNVGEHKGKKIREWKRIPDGAESDDDKNAMSYIKSRMLDLGVPAERINSVTKDDVVGTYVAVTVKTKGEYQNVNKVVIKPEGETPEATSVFG